jgi:toxin HigB-1
MIESFAFIETEKIFQGKTSNKLPKDIQRTARRKLIYLDDMANLFQMVR